MQKFISFIGLLILTVLILLGVLFMGIFYDQLGIITLPQEVKAAMTWRPKPVTIRVERQPAGQPQWSSPLEDLPALPPDALPVLAEPTLPPTRIPPTETPWPTPTAVPPVDPGVYRTEVVLRLKDLVAALEHWIDLNEQLGGQWALLDDPAWQASMYAALGRIQTAGQALSAVTPAPEQYAGIQALLEQASVEAQALVDNYGLAMQTRERAHFTASGDSYKRMKAYLSEAAIAMVDAGWKIE